MDGWVFVKLPMGLDRGEACSGCGMETTSRPHVFVVLQGMPVESHSASETYSITLLPGQDADPNRQKTYANCNAPSHQRCSSLALVDRGGRDVPSSIMVSR